MKIITGPQKGKVEKLDISETQSNRLVVGLSWDAVRYEGHDTQNFQNDPAIDTSSAADLAKSTGAAIFDYFQDIKRSLSYYRYERKAIKRSDKLGQEDNYTHFDLDLHCYIYDKNQDLISYVGPEDLHAIENSESTYHSGDDFSGLGGLDDEQIFVETKNTPEEYAHFFFLVR